MAVGGTGGALIACFGSINSYIVMESETIELVIKESCCGLWNETFNYFAFAMQVN